MDLLLLLLGLSVTEEIIGNTDARLDAQLPCLWLELDYTKYTSMDYLLL